jgi:hypothetical protein
MLQNYTVRFVNGFPKITVTFFALINRGFLIQRPEFHIEKPAPECLSSI